MTSIPSSPTTSVKAAAALLFSVDVDPGRADTQPTVLLLTQNIGGIEAAYGTAVSVWSGSPEMSPSSDTHLPPSAATANAAAAAAAGNNSSGGGVGALTMFPSIIATMTSPSYANVPEDLDVEIGVSAVVRQQVADFLADLRTWLHRMAFVSAAARAAERANGSGGGSSGSPTASSSANTAAAGQSPEFYLRSYTPTARPPLVDVVVIHFQEIGGKYKNKQFNQYFKEQVRTVLLPEAGWTSGLLMDERESDRVVLSSSACPRYTNGPSTVHALATAPQRSSPTSRSGHLSAPTWDYADSSSSRRSSNEVSGGEADLSEEEADPYFTAMGSVVFLSPRIMGITSCLSVPHRAYIPIVDDPMTYAGDVGRLFHSAKYGEAGRSRKGFLLVSLRIGTVQFNVCNVHMFNDDDNRVAMEHSPSKYATRRIRAMQETLAECSAVVNLEEPLFVFGDYNLRMDGKAFVSWAEEKEHITIRPGKKQLRCPDHLWSFFANPAQLKELRTQFDREAQRLMDEMAVQAKVELGEMPIHFAPTYSRNAYRQRGKANGVQPTALAVKQPLQPQKDAAVTEEEELNRTKTPSAVAAAAAAATTLSDSPLVSPPLPPYPTAVAESISHVVAPAGRDNFSHDRLPAWCDRVLFNVAGLEWIHGDRARPPASQVPASSQPHVTSTGTAMRRRVAAEPVATTAPAATSASPSAARWCLYESIDFVHMDHDGVYMLF